MSTKTRYQGTYLGFLWSALEPLFVFVILYLVFSGIYGSTKPDFPIYLLTGVLFFQIFQRGTSNGLVSIQNNANIIKSLNIKKEFFPIVATGSTALLMGIQIIVFFSLLLILDYTPSLELILLIIPTVLLLVLILGLSYFLSIVFVYIKDLQPMWNIFSYGLFFITPIFWYVESVDGILLEIQKINPIGHIIEIAHEIILERTISLNEIGITALMVFVIFVTGFYFFQKFEKKCTEEL